jgi:hypothetical protein
MTHAEISMEMDRGGFIYAASPLGSPILKVGLTTCRDPIAYIIRRYAGVLNVENLMAVTDAANAERLAHFALRDFRHTSFRSRELFVNCLRLMRYRRSSRGRHSW